MLYQDYNASIRDIFKQVEGVSQHGLEQLYDEGVKSGKKILCPSHRRRGTRLAKIFSAWSPNFSDTNCKSAKSRKSRRDIEANRSRGRPEIQDRSTLFVRRRSSFFSRRSFQLVHHRRPDFCFGFGDSFDRLRSWVIVEDLLDTYYAKEESTMGDLLGQVGLQDFEGLDETKENDLTDAANETPIIRFVNLVIQQAIRAQASDIHFEPFEEEFKIRYRVDGALYEMSPPPKSLALPVISRIKVIADLNIAEHRIPQDGRIKLTIEGRAVDLRVSTLPTQFGESVVLRVLDKSAVNLDLDNLGLPENVKTGIRDAVRRPNGIFIVTGPTGSGKTTTLYSALREVNEVETKLLTAEDPVEYELEGIMQVPVNHQVGLDFARALRAFLRQDPDKIMVGEIRDIETARIAVQASLTGHVVLSTLHTNDAPGAITRLIDMGLGTFSAVGIP